MSYASLSCVVLPASTAAVILVSSEVRQGTYDPELSCTTDEAQTVVKRKSKIHCASTCNEQSECREYNFDETTKDCSLSLQSLTAINSLHSKKIVNKRRVWLFGGSKLNEIWTLRTRLKTVKMSWSFLQAPHKRSYKEPLRVISALCGSSNLQHLFGKDTTKDCSLYKHKSLFFQVTSDCSGYKVRSTFIVDERIQSFYGCVKTAQWHIGIVDYCSFAAFAWSVLFCHCAVFPITL